MAAEAPMAEKTVFARKTSGLVKELGAFESFSINLISLGPGPAYGLFLTILYLVPGVNLLYGTILAALVGIPVVVTYAIMAIEMPRSGGEYVYPSRLLHPYLGIVSGLSRMVNVIAYAAILPFWFSTLVVGPGLASWGALSNNAGMLSLGNSLSLGPAENYLSIVIIGEIATFVLMGLYIVMKPRLAFNLFSVLLILELVGLVVSMALLLGIGHDGFVNAVNSFMAGQGYAPSQAMTNAGLTGNYYTDISNYGVTASGQYGGDFGATLMFVPLVFAFYFMFATAPNYIAGEFQRSSRSIRLGMALSYLLSVVFAVAIVVVFEQVVGMNFLNGAVGILFPIAGTPSLLVPMPFGAGLTTMPNFAAGGNGILLGLMFVCATSWYLLWMILGFYIFSRYALSFSLDRLFPKGLSAVSRRTHSPYAGIIVLSIIGAILLPLVTYNYDAVYFPLVYLLFFLPMITVSLTSVSLIRLGMQKHRVGYEVAGGVAFVATAVSAYLVSTLPDLGNAAGFTLANQTTSYIAIVLILVGSAVWYYVARSYNLSKHGVDVAMAFKQLPPDCSRRPRCMTEPLDAAGSPRFAQVATYGRLPLTRDLARARSVFCGIPWDDATSYRSGAREGPSAIRTASRLVRPYNMFADVYPFRVLDTVDWGDVDPVPGYTEDTFQRIESALTPMFARGIVPFIAGGDHSITLPILRSHMAGTKKAASLIHFDAHFDTWESYWGAKRYTHGTWVKRAYEEGLITKGHVFQVGIRSSLYNHEDVPRNAAIVDRTFTVEDVDSQGYAPIMDHIARETGDAPTYVSVDIDVLDPAYAPGTGTPESGGLTSRELIHFVRSLKRLNVVGFDVVEVAPQYDHTGQVTALAASNLLFEAMCAVAVHRKGKA